MTLGSSVVLYLMIGVGVAGALLLRRDGRGASGALQLATGCLFWPLYVPVLLAARTSDASGLRSELLANHATESDPLHREIARVESELDRALQTLDGWAGEALPWEGARFDELKQAWRLQAERIGELSELLDVTNEETSGTGQEGSPEPSVHGAENRKRQSETARRENIERLRELHQRMQDDLRGNLAWVRELVTLIHLAKYTGAPASRAEELVGQIAAAVEGLSRVSDWQSETAAVVTSGAD